MIMIMIMKTTDRWWCSWCSSKQQSCRGSMALRPSHPQCWCTAVASRHRHTFTSVTNQQNALQTQT